MDHQRFASPHKNGHERDRRLKPGVTFEEARVEWTHCTNLASAILNQYRHGSPGSTQSHVVACSRHFSVLLGGVARSADRLRQCSNLLLAVHRTRPEFAIRLARGSARLIRQLLTKRDPRIGGA